mmetsp:Transcript_138615/g.431148  ORF Transcript_138615/g.431148 Transcript_138615/m.431148 type:complete len:561 (-) Transcript_138615:97-1779(-)
MPIAHASSSSSEPEGRRLEHCTLLHGRHACTNAASPGLCCTAWRCIAALVLRSAARLAAGKRPLPVPLGPGSCGHAARVEGAADGVGAGGNVRMRLRRVLDELRPLQLATRFRHDGDRGHVASLVHVIWRREDGDQRELTLMVIAVALSLDLMRAQSHAQAVELHEVPRDVGPEEVDARGHAPGGAVAVLALGVRPEQVDHQGVHRGVGLHEPVGVLDLVKADLDLPAVEADLVVDPLPPDARVGAWDAAVDDEDLVVEHVAQRRRAEELDEDVAQLLLVLHLDLAEEAVEGVGHLRLVVPTVHEDVARLPELQGEDREHHLDAPRTAVHEVAIEDEGVVGRGQAGQAQHVVEVVELPVQVANHCDLLALGHANASERLLLHKDVKGVNGHHVGILHGEQFACLEVGNHLPEECLVDRTCTPVAGPSVAHWLWQRGGVAARGLDRHAGVGGGGLGDLVLDERGIGRQVCIPLVAAVHPVLDVHCRVGLLGILLVGLELYEVDLQGQLGRRVAHAALAHGLELAGGVVEDLVVQQVHDVPEVPAADVRARNGLDGHVLLDA